MGIPPEIVQPAIAAIVIRAVARLHPGRAGADERQEDQAVQLKDVAFSVPHEDHLEIAIRRRDRL
jgi:hypothetical protein